MIYDNFLMGKYISPWLLNKLPTKTVILFCEAIKKEQKSNTYLWGARGVSVMAFNFQLVVPYRARLRRRQRCRLLCQRWTLSCKRNSFFSLAFFFLFNLHVLNSLRKAKWVYVHMSIREIRERASTHTDTRTAIIIINTK